MPNDNVVKLIQPGTFEDQLPEVAEFLGEHAGLKTGGGRQIDLELSFE